MIKIYCSNYFGQFNSNEAHQYCIDEFGTKLDRWTSLKIELFKSIFERNGHYKLIEQLGFIEDNRLKALQSLSSYRIQTGTECELWEFSFANKDDAMKFRLRFSGTKIL